MKLPCVSPLISAGNGGGNWAAVLRGLRKALILLDLLQTPKALPAPHVMLKGLIPVVWVLSKYETED